MSEINHAECERWLGSLSDYVDGEASRELCTLIERHLAGCPNCRVVVDTIRKTISLYQVSLENDGLPAGVRERLYRTLNLDDYLKH
jgi:predicted anti-sigma-YlaC factor YlaD